MEKEQVLLELLKGGIGFLGGTFSNILTDLNKKRLDEKKKRKKPKLMKNADVANIQLQDSEHLRGEVNMDVELATKYIQKHIHDIKRWAEIIKFSDLDKRKTLGAVYIQLDTYLVQSRKHISPVEKNNKQILEKTVLSNDEHCIILGQPGAGKSTSMKKICDTIIKEESNTNYTFPILLRFRNLEDIDTKSPIIDYISKILPLQFKLSEGKESRFSIGKEDAIEEAIYSFLDQIRPIIILDGFDEIVNSEGKSIVLKELTRLSRKLKKAKIVISCRTGEFNAELEHSNTYEIAPLSDQQIELFVHKWLKKKNKAEDFLKKVNSSPFADTSIKPLSLAHLCAIYQRIGDIPDQPKTVYNKVVGLLIEEWDEQRSIKRDSAFEDFQSYKKRDFLSHLAYNLTITYHSSVFTKEQFLEGYKSICEDHDLPLNKASAVVRELEAHTGLLVESGYHKFEYVHKSIQEYLTADYISKLPSPNSVKKHFESLGSELAIVISISSNPSIFFIELVLNYFSRISLSDSFYSSFVSRIISENPTFNNERLISVTTLALISNWINKNNKKYNPADYAGYSEELFHTFKKFSQSIRLKEQSHKISQYYTVSKTVHNNQLVELNRIRTPQDYKRLPSKVYIPIEFYNEFD